MISLTSAFFGLSESQRLRPFEFAWRYINRMRDRASYMSESRTVGSGSIGAPRRFVLLPGAMGCIILCLFFHVQSAGFQAVLLVGLAGFIAMVLFVIITLDRPFVGEAGITADSYQLIYNHHMKR